MSNEETISLPSYNPADVQVLAGLLKFLDKKLKSSIQKVTPAKIVEYDRTTNRATVQVLSYGVTSTGEKLGMKPISNIPVLMLTGGGFTFSFPVTENQTGWLVAADMDISVFKSILAMFTPASYRQHQYEDGFFIPDSISGITPAEDETNAVLLTSLDGTTKITLQNGRAVITASEWIINGDGTINGDLAVNGNVVISGTGEFAGDVTGAGISLSTHTHSGVEPGTGATGLPQ